MSSVVADLTTPELVMLDIATPARDAVIEQLTDRLVTAGRVTDAPGFLREVLTRESEMPTGMPGHVGLPHARSSYVTALSVALARVPHGVDFGSTEGPATLVMLIAAPVDQGVDFLRVLASVARQLFRPSFVAGLHNVVTPLAAAELINRKLGS